MIAARETIFPYSEQAKHAVDCPVCGTHNPSTPIHDRYGYAVPLAQCQTCSMIYLAEQMDRAGYDRFYAGGYRGLIGALSGKARVRQMDSPSVPFLVQTVGLLIPGFGPRSVLDAGGSSGVVGQLTAQRYGATVTVLDPAAQELPGGVQTIRGYLEDGIPGHYDLAVCIATSDHLTDPLAALRNLRQAADVLVIDYIDVHERARAGRPPQTKIDHPLYWTAPAMRRALAETGWKPWRSVILADHNTHKYAATMLSCR